MRVLPSSVQTYLTKKTASKPFNIIKVYWSDTNIREYADKLISADPSIENRILEIQSIDSIININKNSSNESVAVKLDDHDGQIKAFFNTIDIHKKKVKIYQWFEGIDLIDKFLILVGKINTPIIWDESDRTLSFTVLSEIDEDNEVGFSAEEGDIKVPQNLIGKAFPIVFGQVLKLPGILIDSIESSGQDTSTDENPTNSHNPDNSSKDGTSRGASGSSFAFTIQDIGMGDPTITPYLGLLSIDIDQLNELAKIYFNGALAASAIADQLGEPTGSFGDGEPGQFRSMADQYTESGNQIVSQIGQLNNQKTTLTQVKDQHEAAERTEVDVFGGDKFPQNEPVTVQIGQYQFDGIFNGTRFGITKKYHPDASTVQDFGPQNVKQSNLSPDSQNQTLEGAMTARVRDLIPRSKFILIKAGSRVTLQSNFTGDNTTTSDQEFSDQPTSVLNADGTPNGQIVQMRPNNYAELLDSNGNPSGVYMQVHVNPNTLFPILDNQGNPTGRYIQVKRNPNKKTGSGGTGKSMPIRYLVSSFIPVVISGVWAKYDGKLTIVPPSLYKRIFVLFDTIQTTCLYFSNPLSVADDKWDDDIFVDCKSDYDFGHGNLGQANPVRVMKWIIDTYTDFDWDPTSFNSVEADLDTCSCNFALLDKKKVSSFLQEIAWQARCSIDFDADSDTFYLRFLPKAATPTDSISEDDCISKSISITTTDTEEVITKFVATWHPDYQKGEVYKVIIRYNINKYGLNEKSYSFYIYSNIDMVQKCATFWAIRYANIWKKLECTLPINKIAIETLDTITLDFNNTYIATVAVNGEVEACVLNTDDPKLTLTVWTPVRLGEMLPFDWAFPGDLTISEVWPPVEPDKPEDVGSNKVHKGAKNPDKKQFPPGTTTGRGVVFPDSSSGIDVAKAGRLLSGDGTNSSVGSLNRPADWGATTTNLVDGETTQFELTTQVDTTQLPQTRATTDVDALNKYRYKQYEMHKLEVQRVTSVTVPGKIVSGEGNTYTVDAYFSGINNQPTTIKDVRQLDILDGVNLPSGVWVHVTRTVWMDKSNKQHFELTMQAPVWLEDITTE